MKEVYTSSNSSFCWILKSLLESEEIECEIFNDQLSLVSGDIPFDQAWPQLCILNDDDFQKATEIIDKNKPRFSDLPSFCPACDSEEIDLHKAGNAIFFDEFKCKKCGNIWRKK